MSKLQLAAGAIYRKPEVRKTSEKPLLRIVTLFLLVISPLKIFLPPCHATVVSADAHCLHPGRDTCVSRTVRMEPTAAVSHRESCHASSYLHVVQVSDPVFANVRGSTATAFAGLFPFWDDIDADTGNVYWEQRLFRGINTLIVQWHNRPHFSNIGSATFQVQVFATGSKLVRFAYQDVDFGDASFNNGASATIGIVSPGGDVSQHSFNTADSVLSGDVIDYSVLTDVDEYEFTGVAGETVGVIFDGLNGVNLRNSTVQLLRGATLLATAVSNLLSTGVTATNFDLGISAFVLPASDVYTIRIVGRTKGEYVTLVTRNAAEHRIRPWQQHADQTAQRGGDSY